MGSTDSRCGRSFVPTNVLRIERFVAGKADQRWQALRLLPAVYCGPELMEALADLDHDSSLVGRMLSIKDALVLHARLCGLLGLKVPTLAEAVSSASAGTPAALRMRFQGAVSRANAAKHHELGSGRNWVHSDPTLFLHFPLHSRPGTVS